MHTAQFNQLVSFIWNIANDVLANKYGKGDYRKVILPMIVIRRFDVLLEPTKKKVLQAKERLSKSGVENQDAALCIVAQQDFCNTSPFTLKMFGSRPNPQQLKNDFIAYLDGFSQNVQDLIDKFKFRNEIDTLMEAGVLGLLIDKFIDPRINLSNKSVLNDDGTVRLPALDNHTIGTVFEELLRKFNEENNVTEAGEYFTPRDVVTLMADLAFVPVKEHIASSTYSIYDGACGTGGILSVSEERIKALGKAQGKAIQTHIYGQELRAETYATCKSDLLIKGRGEAENICFGSTISDDKLIGKTFNFCISNPPFGKPWKSDLENWGIKKTEITDKRFIKNYGGDPAFSLVPNIGDAQMLFLANNLARMKEGSKFGTRIVEVHNGSSLFTGSAGGGESNLRRYIIEQDLLEAIVALPQNMFYNTGISTFIWILSNKKEARRKGKVQLIDASAIKTPLRKNLGDKNCELSTEDRDTILQLLIDFKDNEYSRIFPNKEFGYYEITLDRPLRLRVIPDADISSLEGSLFKVCSQALQAVGADTPLNDWNKFADRLALNSAQLKKLRPLITQKDETAVALKNEIDPDLRDTEQVPLLYEGGIKAFMKNEVLPYAPDAYVDATKTKIGYELSFTKYFYKPAQFREITEIKKDIRDIAQRTQGLLNDIISD